MVDKLVYTVYILHKVQNKLIKMVQILGLEVIDLLLLVVISVL